MTLLFMPSSAPLLMRKRVQARMPGRWVFTIRAKAFIGSRRERIAQASQYVRWRAAVPSRTESQKRWKSFFSR